jgi:hypothetical protein
MIPAAVSHTEMNIEISCANLKYLRNQLNGFKILLDLSKPFILKLYFYLMDVDVFKMLRYCKMSGTVIKRRARKKRKPKSENN